MTQLAAYTGIRQLVTLDPLVKQQRWHQITRQDLGILTDAWLVIEGSKILDYGTGPLPERFHKVPSTDLGGALVLPGLIDCHSHPLFAGDRSHEFAARLDGQSYQQIAADGGGIMSTVRATRAASDELLKQSCRQRLLEMARWGATTIECKTGYALDPQEEVRHLRILNQLQAELPLHLEITSLGLHAIPPPQERSQSQFIKAMTDQLSILAEEGLCQWVDAFVEKGYFEAEDVDDYFSKANQLGLKIRIHADEFADSGAALAAARWGAASADHLEMASPQGIAAMAASGCVAVLLPGTSLYCAIPFTQAAAFRAAGVPLAVATDFNPGSCVFYNLPMMATIAALHGGLNPAEAIAGVTFVAARSLRQEHQRGAVQKGWYADFCISPLGTIDHWLADAGRTAPQMVLCQGQILH